MRQPKSPAPFLVYTLLLFTAWPFLYMGLFFLYIAAAMFSIGMGREGHGLPWMGVFMPLSLLTLLETMVLMVLYAMHIIFNPLLALEKKIGWGIGLIVASVFAMPAYWYLYFWQPMREQRAEEGKGAGKDEGDGKDKPRTLPAL